MFQQSNNIGATSAPEAGESGDAAAAVAAAVVAAGVPAAWSESGSRLVSIPDVSGDVMRHFLLYLYGSRVPEDLEEQLAEELLIVADKYDVERLKNACESALSKCCETELGRTIGIDIDRLIVVQYQYVALTLSFQKNPRILVSSHSSRSHKNGRAFGAPPFKNNHCDGAYHFAGQGHNAEGSRLRARPRIYMLQK